MPPKARNRRRGGVRTYDAVIVTAQGHGGGDSQRHRWKAQLQLTEGGTLAGTNDLSDIDHRLLQLAKYTTTPMPALPAVSGTMPATASIDQRLWQTAMPTVPVNALGVAAALPSSTVQNQFSEPSPVRPLPQEPSGEERKLDPMYSSERSLQGSLVARAYTTHRTPPTHGKRPHAPTIDDQRIGYAHSWQRLRDFVATRFERPRGAPPACENRPYWCSIGELPYGRAYASKHYFREQAVVARPDAACEASPAMRRLPQEHFVHEPQDRLWNSPWSRPQKGFMARESHQYGTPPFTQRSSHGYFGYYQRVGNVNTPLVMPAVGYHGPAFRPYIFKNSVVRFVRITANPFHSVVGCLCC
ncbi:hypothetical protein MRX96_036068 [Rhipicephalus microplus]